MVRIPSAARKSLIGGETFWAEPRTSWPRLRSSAASVAMAVPATPISWMHSVSLNRRLLDNYGGLRASLDAHARAERQRPAGAGGVSRRKSDQHGSGKVVRVRHDHLARRQRAR